MNLRYIILLLAVFIPLSAVVFVPLSAVGAPKPYTPQLHRLAELLGSMHYLGNLCENSGSQWRDHMQDLIASENPNESEKSLIIARFNAGYRSLTGNHVQCNSNSRALINLYTKEGTKLLTRILQKFGE